MENGVCWVGVWGDESEMLGGEESSSTTTSTGLTPRSDPELFEDGRLTLS